MSLMLKSTAAACGLNGGMVWGTQGQRWSSCIYRRSLKIRLWSALYFSYIPIITIAIVQFPLRSLSRNYKEDTLESPRRGSLKPDVMTWKYDLHIFHCGWMPYYKQDHSCLIMHWVQNVMEDIHLGSRNGPCGWPLENLSKVAWQSHWHATLHLCLEGTQFVLKVISYSPPQKCV